MTQYFTNKASATPKYLDTAAGVNSIAVYTFGTTGLPTLQIGDTFVCEPIPAGVAMFDVELDTDRLDGGGTPSLVLSVGDALVPGRYMTGITAGRAGGLASPNVFGWTGFAYSATTSILVTVTATANGPVPANAGIRVTVSYTADP